MRSNLEKILLPLIVCGIVLFALTRKRYSNVSSTGIPKLKYFNASSDPILFRDIEKMDPKLLLMLDRFREIYGKPLIITSAYRSEEQNAKTENASDKSQHIYGRAVDLYSPGSSVSDLPKMINAAQLAGFQRIGVYPHWSTPGLHVDSYTPFTRWSLVYRNGKLTYVNGVHYA